MAGGVRRSAPHDRSVTARARPPGDSVREAKPQLLPAEVHRGMGTLPVGPPCLALDPVVSSLFGATGPELGSTVLLTGLAGQGMTTLALALFGAPTRARLWTGVLNCSRISLLSATELDVALEHLVVIPGPTERVAAVAAVLMEGCSLVLLGSDRPVTSREANRLQQRAREHRCVLLVLAPASRLHAGALSASAYRHCWPEVPDTVITVVSSACNGIGRGDGYLLNRQIRVEVAHRRGARTHEVHELCLVNAELPARAPGQPLVVEAALRGVG